MIKKKMERGLKLGKLKIKEGEKDEGKNKIM